MNLLELATRFQQKDKEIKQLGNQKKIKIALIIEKDLTQVTPVDTTQAVSNWQVKVGTKASSPVLPYSTTRQTSAAIAVSIAENELKRAKPGQPVYISNLLPYINKLNDGSSKQAPAGFKERAVLIGRLNV